MDSAFSAWCRAAGVAFSGVEPGMVAEGWRGLVATRPVAEDEEVLRVPATALMWRGSAEADETVRRVLEVDPGLSPQGVLAAHLLAEGAKGTSSRWELYVRQIPRSFSTAAYFDDESLGALGCDEALTRVSAARQRALDAAARLSSAVRRASWSLREERGRGARAEGGRGGAGSGAEGGGLEAGGGEEGGGGRAGSLAAEGDAGGLGRPGGRGGGQAPPPPPAPLPAAACSLGAARWALSAVSSRTMFLEADSAGCLTPAGDLFNHRPSNPPLQLLEGDLAEAIRALAERPPADLAGRAERTREIPLEPRRPAVEPEPAATPPPPIGCRLDEASGCYVLRASRSAEPGDQVFLNYGDHGNLDLVILYGFVASPNFHDTCALPARAVFPSGEAPDALRGEGGGGASPACCLTANGCPSFALLRALRLSHATPEARKKLAWRALRDEPIDLDSERGAWEAVARGVLAARARAGESGGEAGGAGRGRGPDASPPEPGCLEVARAWRAEQDAILGRAERVCARLLATLERAREAAPARHGAAPAPPGLRVSRPRFLP